MKTMLQGKTVLLGVSGGIAAYKAVEVTSRLVQLGASVHVLMTEAATKLVAPLTFQAIAGNPVRVEMMAPQSITHVDHVTLTHRADLLIIAPATANTIANLAGGHAADWITITALGVSCPVLLAPAMEAEMFASPLTQQNLAKLSALGWRVMEPVEGRLASGLTGKGRLPEPAAIVDEAVGLLVPQQDLKGRKVLVTAGTTREALDPVRFIGNRSTGKMGYAIAAAAAQRGANVILVSGPTNLQPPSGVERIEVESCRDMLEAAVQAYPGTHILVGAAAPADYRPSDYHEQKLKKSGEEMTITLMRNPDIMAELGRRKASGAVHIAFAAETQNLVVNARAKLAPKGADFIVANDVTGEGAGFGHETNRVTLVFAEHEEELPLLSKAEVAHRMLEKAVGLLGG